MLEESLAIWKQADDTTSQAITLTSLGASRLGQGNIEQAKTLLSEAQALAERQSNPLIKYVTLENLGHLASRQGKGKRALAFYYEALSLAEQAKDDGQVARLLNAIGDEYAIQGSYDAAEECFTRAAMICNQLGNRIVGAYISGNRGVMALKRGDYVNAQNHLQEAIREVHDQGDKVKAILCLGHFATLARMQENPERSVQLLSAGESLRSVIGLTLSKPMQTEVEQSKIELKEQLGDAAYVAAWQRGNRMSYEQAMAFVLKQ
jgi:tetratricopeptide (TPR) repeat protein